MAFAPDINTTLSNQSWTQQALANNVATGNVAASANIAAGQPINRVRKGKDDRPVEVLGELFPIAAIRDDIEAGLSASIRTAIGTLSTLVVDDETFISLRSILGEPDDPSGLVRCLTDLGKAFAKPADALDSNQIAGKVTSVAEHLKRATGQIQTLRAKADRAIGRNVADANAVLQHLAELNTKITLAIANGNTIRDSDEERDGTLDKLSSLLDFSSFDRDDGTVAVFTKQGTPLVNGTPTLLTHRAVTEIAPAMSFENGQLSGILADGIDITHQISGGAVHAWLKTRDQTLPNAQNQLDTLAQTLQAQINQVCNRQLAAIGLPSLCRSSRRFQAPGHQRFSLSGGDVLVSELRQDTEPAAATSLTSLMKLYQRDNGLPSGHAWSAPHLVAALNAWLVLRNGTGTVALDEEGHLCLERKPGESVRLTLQDRRSIVLESRPFGDPDKPLGLSGPLVFTDNAGNMMSTTRASPPTKVVPTDSLSVIAAKLATINGLNVSKTSDADGVRLRVASTTGSDMALEADPPGSTVGDGLGFTPCSGQVNEEVVVNYRTDSRGGHLLSRPLPTALTALGLSGPLTLCDQDGTMLTQLTLAAGWSLTSLAQEINRTSKGKGINASIVATGNQVILKIATQPGQQIQISGAPDAYHTTPCEQFAAKGGTLSLLLGGKPAGTLSVATGSNLLDIASALNEETGPFAAQGIQGEVLTVGTASYLEIGCAKGWPLSFEGTAFGRNPGQLDLALNVRDALGLMPPAHQVITGFANFLGLNDIFVADPPGSFDGKASTGIFASTAVPGTAQRLALNPLMCDELADPTLAGAISDQMNTPVNIAAAGDMERGNHALAHYAGALVAKIADHVTQTKGQATFEQTLLDGIRHQRTGVGNMSMTDRVSTLTTYQKAFHDSACIVSTMTQLFGSLGNAALH